MPSKINVTSSPSASASWGMQLMQEIKRSSALTHEELSSALEPDVEIQPDLLSHYLSGQKEMGMSRMIELANAAVMRGWHGPMIDLIDFFGDQDIVAADRAMNKIGRDMRKEQRRANDSAITNIRKAILNLRKSDWPTEKILALMMLLVAEDTIEERIDFGGVVDLLPLLELVQAKPDQYPALAWVECKLVGMNEANPTNFTPSASE
ncbi:MAG: hypothetical protein PHI29_10875 [Gallionella sp.]|nr:hypothetical protein [Gallionella sp.]